MFKNRLKGKFIAVEGLDGSGASTQVAAISSFLKKNKKTHLITQEPTNSVIGGLIKSYLTGDLKIASPESLQLLFTADRANHLKKEIIPKLEKGINVITDRYFLSSLAYGSLEINDTDWLFNINDQFIIPDLTILIKVSAKICTARIKESRNGIELFEKEEMLNKVWKTYETLAKKYPNIKVIDGEKSEEEVSDDIFKELTKIIK